MAVLLFKYSSKTRRWANWDQKKTYTVNFTGYRILIL